MHGAVENGGEILSEHHRTIRLSESLYNSGAIACLESYPALPVSPVALQPFCHSYEKLGEL